MPERTFKAHLKYLKSKSGCVSLGSEKMEVEESGGFCDRMNQKINVRKNIIIVFIELRTLSSEEIRRWGDLSIWRWYDCRCRN